VRLTFLGTGTSFGVPVVGCRCEVCTSADARDRRSRHAAVVREGDVNVLIDTPPDLRSQLLQADLGRVDAVWFTHDHADHTHGIDDLRVFSARLRQPLPAFADTASAASLRRKFAYIFDDGYRPPEGTTKPEISLHDFDGSAPVRVAGLDFIPLAVPHGDMVAWGFRCGDLGYITDGKLLPPAVEDALSGVRVLVLNALWFGRPHPTHFNVEEAIAAANRIGAPRTYLTHLTHRLRHGDLLERLPQHVRPAYDGLTIQI
jgi:phosphoribosyl 1,2-cyclic phosphate phosphodiesterase